MADILSDLLNSLALSTTVPDLTTILRLIASRITPTLATDKAKHIATILNQINHLIKTTDSSSPAFGAELNQISCLLQHHFPATPPT
jgi:hypothetical protein